MDIKSKKSAKEVLGLEELSPLETGEIIGGSDKEKQKKQQQQKESDEPQIIEGI